VLLGTCVPMPVPAPLLDLAERDPLAAIDRVVVHSFSTLAAKPSYPGPGAWLRGGGRQLMRLVLAHQGDRRLFHTDFSNCDRYAGGLDAATRVRAPTSLILGARDQMTLPRGARDVAGRLGARVHEVAAGHFLMQEQPDPVLQALRQALS
jgi:pimeloyl-ACP methyl ester carboxylesterase